MIHQSSAIVDLSNKNDNNQNRIDPIVLINKTNDEICDEARKEEIKNIKLHSNGCIVDGQIDGFIESCASDNCKNYHNLDKILKLCSETIGCNESKQCQDEKKDSDDNNKEHDSIKNGVSNCVII